MGMVFSTLRARAWPARRDGLRVAAMASKRKADLRWVKTPLQSRSHRTLQSILDATVSLLEDKDFDQLGVNDIVQEAGTSVGAFYGRFRSKEDVLRLLRERDLAESIATVTEVLAPERWETTSLESLLREIVAFSVENSMRPLGLRRAFLQRTMHDEDFRAWAIEGVTATIDLLEGLLEERREEFGYPDPRGAAEMLFQILVATMNHHVMLAPHTPLGAPFAELDERELIDRLVHVGLRFLEVSGD